MDLQAFFAGLTTAALSILAVLGAVVAFCELFQRFVLKTRSVRAVLSSLPRVRVIELSKPTRERFDPFSRELEQMGFERWGDLSFCPWHGPMAARYFIGDDRRTIAWLTDNGDAAELHFANLFADGAYLETSNYDVVTLTKGRRPTNETAEAMFALHCSRQRHQVDVFGAHPMQIGVRDLPCVVDHGQRMVLAAYMQTVTPEPLRATTNA